MNPILADMYSTVIPSAPYLIAAYAIVWLALLVYVAIIARGIKHAEAQISLLEQAIEKSRQGHDGNDGNGTDA